MTGLIIFLVLLYCFYLHNKISNLEKKITQQIPTLPPQSISDQSSTSQSNTSATATSTPATQPAMASTMPAMPTAQSAATDAAFIKWLTTDWLLKLGALLLLIGIAWFVSYAFAENWIGPVGRVTLGLVVGSAILLFGEWRGSKSEMQGTVFMVVGAVTILLTTYAARTVYDFFTPLSALGIMMAAIVTMSISSVVHKTVNRASLSLVLAAVVPFLTASADTSVIGLLSYAFIIITGTIWIVSITGWRQLTVLALSVYWIYSLMSMVGPEADDIFLLRIFVFAFGLLFYATGLIAHLRVQNSSYKEFVVSLGNALLFAIWIKVVIPDNLLSIVTSAVALLFFVGAYITAKFTKQSSVVLQYVGVALALLAAAATFELQGPALIITYSIIICIGMYLTLKLKQKLHHAQAIGLLFVPVFLNSFIMIQTRNYIRQSADYGPVITWWILAAELLAIGYLFYKTATRENNKTAITVSAVYLIAGAYLGLFTLWNNLEMLITKADTAHATALVISTILGLGLYIVSRVGSHKKSMYTGASILGFVVIRLLLVEVWDMELFQRVIIFILIGILLMTTAFIHPKKKEVGS